MADLPTMKELLDAGVHFGHQTRRWNPKMKPFIHSARNGIHILDLAQTVQLLNVAVHFARQTAADGEEILFVGTKKQAQELIRGEAERCQMPYVINRWLGGTLTNWQTIQTRINHMQRLERMEFGGEFATLPKKEALRYRRELQRLHRHLGGVRDMARLPGALFIVDVPKEHIAVLEANRLDIPIIAICDTNSDPTTIDYPIPSNDDAFRALGMITKQIADAVVEGRLAVESARADQAAAAAEADAALAVPTGAS